MNKLTGIKNLQLLRRIAGTLLLAVMLAGCDPEESCVSLTTNDLQLGFFVVNKKGVAEPAPFTFDEIDVLRSDNNFFVDNQAGSGSANLALDPDSDSTTFIFKYEEKADTLILSYNRDIKLVSPECGIEINYSDIQVFRHTFDSVRVITPVLSGTDKGFDVGIYSLDSCNSPITNLVMAGFKMESDEGEEVNIFANFDLIRAVGMDTALFKRNESGINQISLPLNLTVDSTAFIFVDGETRDTLVINYDRVDRIYSPECGLQTEITNINLSGNHSFDSVRVLNPNLSKTNQGFDIEIIK